MIITSHESRLCSQQRLEAFVQTKLMYYADLGQHELLCSSKGVTIKLVCSLNGLREIRGSISVVVFGRMESIIRVADCSWFKVIVVFSFFFKMQNRQSSPWQDIQFFTWETDGNRNLNACYERYLMRMKCHIYHPSKYSRFRILGDVITKLLIILTGSLDK